MALHARDVVPISEARARLTELAEDVVGGGTEKLLTKNGASYVALIDARKLDYYHALEEGHAEWVLAQAALEGLRDVAAGRVLEEAELTRVLAAKPPPLAEEGGVIYRAAHRQRAGTSREIVRDLPPGS